MRAYEQPEADAMDAPADPTAQNAATEALKPKPVPAVGSTPDDPNAPKLPTVQPSSAAPAVNMDPNAYAPPPQGAPDTPAPADAAPMPTLSAPGAPDQTQTFNLPNAATQFPGADGKGDVSGGGSGGQFWQRFDQSQSGQLSPDEQSKATRMMRGDQSLMNEYKQQYGSGWFDKWGADQDMYDKRLRNQTATAGDINSLKGKSGQEAWDVISGKTTIGGSQDGSQMGTNYMNALKAMTPDQRTQFLGQWEEGSYDRALIEGSLAAQGITAGNADTGQRWDGKTQNNGAMASAIPVYSNDVRGEGQNSQGLAGYGQPAAPPTGQAAGTVPSGPASPAPIPAPTPTPSAAPPAGSPSALPAPAPSGASVESAVPAGPGSVITTMAGGQNSGAPALPTPAPSGYAPPTASGMGNVAQRGTTEANALTNSTLSRQDGADRFKIAGDQWDAFTKSTAPQYEADQRAAMRRAAAGGALGSGMLQTSLGDLASNRALALDTQKQNFLSEALKGNIDDQFRDVGVAQQQQGFQQGQQQQAFGNEVTKQNLQESLTNGSFQRALQQLTAGSSGNPADTALLLSQIFGGQASEAGSSLAALLGGLGQKNAGGAPTGGGSGVDIGSLLSAIFGGGTKTTGTPTSTTVYGGQ